MIERILSGSVRYRWLVLFLTAIVAIIGAWQLNLLPIDVTPTSRTSRSRSTPWCRR
jgi:cobalt-zinc-cadmium resistance protein CzcA